MAGSLSRGLGHRGQGSRLWVRQVLQAPSFSPTDEAPVTVMEPAQTLE